MENETGLGSKLSLLTAKLQTMKEQIDLVRRFDFFLAPEHKYFMTETKFITKSVNARFLSEFGK